MQTAYTGAILTPPQKSFWTQTIGNQDVAAQKKYIFLVESDLKRFSTYLYIGSARAKERRSREQTRERREATGRN